MNKEVVVEVDAREDMQKLKDGEEVVEVPMPEWLKDGKKVRQETLEDESLKEQRDLAEKKERGFEWVNELLMHRDRKGPDDQCSRIVVPQSRRSELFHLAHSALTGGHFHIEEQDRPSTGDLLDQSLVKMFKGGVRYAQSANLHRKPLVLKHLLFPCRSLTILLKL